MDNQINVVGNIVAAVESGVTASGRAFANFRLAVNRSYRVGDEWKEETSFLRCVAWNGLAQHITETFTKGMRVIVNGRIQQRSWDTEDGQTRSTLEVVVEDCGPSLRWADAVVTKEPKKEG